MSRQLLTTSILLLFTTVAFQNCSPEVAFEKLPEEKTTDSGSTTDQTATTDQATNNTGNPNTTDSNSTSSTDSNSTSNSSTSPANCTLGGMSVQHNQTVTAYKSSTVSYNQSCLSESRTCNNGTLSGTFTNLSCVKLPAPPGDCDGYWNTCTSKYNDTQGTQTLVITEQPTNGGLTCEQVFGTSKTRTCTGSRNSVCRTLDNFIIGNHLLCFSYEIVSPYVDAGCFGAEAYPVLNYMQSGKHNYIQYRISNPTLCTNI